MAERRQPTAEERVIGERLQSLRVRQGLRPIQVAIRLGMSQQNYQAYECGRHIISSVRLDDFAWALGVSRSKLMDALYDEDFQYQRVSGFRSETPAQRPVDRCLVMAGA